MYNHLLVPFVTPSMSNSKASNADDLPPDISKAPACIGATTAFYVLALILCICRLQLRIRNKRFGADDWLLCVAMVSLACRLHHFSIQVTHAAVRGHNVVHRKHHLLRQWPRPPRVLRHPRASFRRCLHVALVRGVVRLFRDGRQAFPRMHVPATQRRFRALEDVDLHTDDLRRCLGCYLLRVGLPPVPTGESSLGLFDLEGSLHAENDVPRLDVCSIMWVPTSKLRAYIHRHC